MAPRSETPDETPEETPNSENADNYGLTPQNEPPKENESDTQHETNNEFRPFADVLDSEPADPPPHQIDDETRRQTRIAGPDMDPSRLPPPLVECGCGSCEDRYDPLADEYDGAFDDVLDRDVYAVEECPDPRPVTVERAATITPVYETASYRAPERTARIEWVRTQHGRLMDAERQLLDEWNADDGDVTTALLSLRLSPIEYHEGTPDDEDDENADYYGLSTQNRDNPGNGETDHTDDGTDESRYWVPPVTLCERLADGWRKGKRRLRYHLRDYEWGYCWVIATTDSAATPHLHVYVWIRDPDDEVTVEDVRPAIDAYVEHTPGAHPEDHPIEVGESDAAVIDHDPPILGVTEEKALYISSESELRTYQPNTAGFAYLLNQRPEWGVAPLCSDDDSGDPDDVDLDGAAIAWSSTKRGIGYGGAFDVETAV